jgi:hypothetical protein
MVFGVMLYGYITSTIASMLSHGELRKLSYVKQLRAVRMWMKDHELNTSLVERVEAFYRYNWRRNHGVTAQDLFDKLPKSLESEVCLVINKDIIKKVDLFRSADMGFMRGLSLIIKPLLFLPGDLIVQAGDIGTTMFFINKGTVSVENNGVEVCQLTSGQFFGEIGLIHAVRRTATIKAITPCDLMIVTRKDMDTLLRFYPELKYVM